MTLIFSSFLLTLFGLSVILITLSLRFLRGAIPAGESYSSPARFFLIALRLAIGWHCFVEGMEKMTTPTWSSEVYLRESMGPASGAFRALAGDRLIAKLTVGEDGAFPTELEREWNGYVNAFSAYYELTGEQIEKAQAILAERKMEALAAFAQAESVTKISAYPPDLKIDMTMKQRLDEHVRLSERVRAAEASFPTSDKDVHTEWKTAKANLAKWRAELQKSIGVETTKLKKALTDLLTSEQKQNGPMPEPKGVPIASWRLLEIADFLVKWSLVILGACLLLGLFSRAASLATALLILSFYAAMPALPGWPESPRLEGHYLLINKTLIEVIALLALTFIPTGRWAGLDGLLCLCCCGNAKTPPSQANPAAPQAPATQT
jgi:uncharacterized membrane protein YphA (DoxX/SURF4 family)